MMVLGALMLASALATSGANDRASPQERADTLRVVLIVDDTAARQSLLRGARLGAEEASHTGALFGMVVTLQVESSPAPVGMARPTDSPASESSRPSLVIVAGDAGTCSRLLSQSGRDSLAVLDAGCAEEDSTRGPNVYSLVPARVATPAGDSTRVESWHWSIERFGGEQLNQRYLRRFAARMDSPAWTGWMAMKIALDAALHAKVTAGAALLRQLADPRAQYDGQKGRPLRFAADTRRLVQPLYRVAGTGDGEHVVAEVEP